MKVVAGCERELVAEVSGYDLMKLFIKLVPRRNEGRDVIVNQGVFGRTIINLICTPCRCWNFDNLIWRTQKGHIVEILTVVQPDSSNGIMEGRYQILIGADLSERFYPLVRELVKSSKKVVG